MANNRKAQVAKTATQALVILWQESFFRAWKNKGAIDQTLAKRGNNFSTPELGMALRRAKHLTRRGKAGSYEYIQKYPYVPADETRPTKKIK
jgi:hypothetical protein